MTSSNINKIVQNNLNLKPWVLSKNTSEIVNTCIQKIYKQMPTNFRKVIKPHKMISPRPENFGPLRAFKNQQRQMSKTKITPRKLSNKKPSKSTIISKDNNLIKSVKGCSKHNLQNSQKFLSLHLTPSKKLLKSPNYQIYKSRRFGSSGSSSSRSSIFRRSNERRRQPPNYTTQINYLVRSFHNSAFEGTYAKYLMPIRNQHIDSRLGSVPDAIRISTDIQNGLMKIDTQKRNSISLVSDLSAKNKERLDDWRHPPSKDLYQKVQSAKQSAKKIHVVPQHSKLSRLSSEYRDYEHNHSHTELQEQHRRNRMKKLGMIERSPLPPNLVVNKKTTQQTRQLEQQSATVTVAAAVAEAYSFQKKWTPSILAHMKANNVLNKANQAKSNSSKYQSSNNYLKTFGSVLAKEGSTVLKSSPSNVKGTTISPGFLECKEVSKPCCFTGNSIIYTSTGPTAAVISQVTKNPYYKTHPSNRSDFFKPKKY